MRTSNGPLSWLVPAILIVGLATLSWTAAFAVVDEFARTATREMLAIGPADR